MNRLNKLFYFVYPGVLSAPTSVQYYDLAKIEHLGLPGDPEKNTQNEWAHAVIRNVQKPWWRKASKPGVAA
jgi:hypothetical protein